MEHAAPPKADTADIERFSRSLMAPGAVHELRALHTEKGTVSGYFDNSEKLVRAAATCSGRGQGVYITLNPVNPDLLARANNRLQTYAKHTTANGDVVCRQWLILDFDPKRPSGISSTEAEHAAALEQAAHCRDTLQEQGWPDPIQLDTGNGAALLYRIDLPNAPASDELVAQVLRAAQFRFETEQVSVDQGWATRRASVGSPARPTAKGTRSPIVPIVWPGSPLPRRH